ncbi:MAG: YncE family protein [Thermoplasmataceae archaeon]
MNNLNIKSLIKMVSSLFIIVLLVINIFPVTQINTIKTPSIQPYSTSINNSGNIIGMGSVTGNFSLGSHQTNFSSKYNPSSLEGMVFDPQDGYLYATSGNYIFAINASLNKLTKVIDLGKAIEWIGYDSANAMLYSVVLENNSITSGILATNSSIVSIDPSSGKTTTLLSNFSYSSYTNTIDPMSNTLFFTGAFGNIMALNLTTKASHSVSNASSNPQKMSYNKWNGYLYESEGNYISIINTKNDSLTNSQDLKNYSSCFVYDRVSKSIITSFFRSNRIDILNGTTGKITNHINCAIQATGMAYNPRNQYAYFYTYNGTVRILNATTLSPEGSFKVSPFGTNSFNYNEYSAYDSSSNEVYLGYTIQGEIISINGSSVPSGGIYLSSNIPIGLFYDQYNNLLYVSTNNGTLYSFNSTNLIEQGKINIGLCAQYFAIDPSSGYLYVSSGISNSVSIVNTKTFSVIKNISVGLDPGNVIYCTQTKDVYVLNRESNNISVINKTGRTVASISFFQGYNWGNPHSMIYDKKTNDIYVTYNFGGNGPIDAISITKMQYLGFLTGLGYDIIYDPIDGNIIGSGGMSWTPSTNNSVNIPSLEYSFSSPVYDPLNQNILAIQLNRNSASNGIAIINATTEYLEGNVTMGVSLSSITVDTSNGLIFVSSQYFNKIYVVKLYPEYDMNFKESGMNSPESWFINMNGRPENFNIVSTAESIYLPNGTYTYSIGTSQFYSVSPQSGIIQVNGKGFTVAVTFSFNYKNYLFSNYIYILIIAGVVLASVYFIWMRRR